MLAFQPLRSRNLPGSRFSFDDTRSRELPPPTDTSQLSQKRLVSKPCQRIGLSSRCAVAKVVVATISRQSRSFLIILNINCSAFGGRRASVMRYAAASVLHLGIGLVAAASVRPPPDLPPQRDVCKTNIAPPHNKNMPPHPLPQNKNPEHRSTQGEQTIYLLWSN